MNEHAELIKEFLLESYENLDRLDRDFVALEQHPGDAATLSSIFRTIHTIKGTCGFLGFRKLESVTHVGENLLSRLRDGKLTLTSERTSAMLAMVDATRAILRCIENTGSEGEVEYSELVTALERLVEGEEGVMPDGPPSTGTTAVAGTAVAGETVAGATVAGAAALDFEVVHSEIDAALAGGTPPVPVVDVASLAAESRGAGPSATFPKASVLIVDGKPVTQKVIGTAGAVSNTSAASSSTAGAVSGATAASSGTAGAVSNTAGAVPNPVAASNGAVSSSLAVGTGPERVTEAAWAAAGTPVASPGGSSATATVAGATRTDHGSGIGPAGGAGGAAGAGGAELEAGRQSVADSAIRVDVVLLDRLMNLVGELVLARNQILQHTAGAENNALGATTQRLNLITTELQEGVMKTRMQPIQIIWQKFPRVVRDLSGQFGKRIRLEMEGKETELDKTIVEAIKDPLTHIVRNSVDHGIETPQVRAARGKPEEGRLLLRAFHEGGQVNIEIADDGGGIHPEKVKAKAVEKGLITAEQAARLGDREAVNLIFLPGFSTAETITNVSGRGVGMDVVKTNIEKIGGTVEVLSRPGEGTTLRIKIPLTLAIIPALLVTSGGERFAIPQVSLLELVRLDGDEARGQIETVHGASVYRLRGNLLPLVSLSRQLRLPEPPSDATVNIVVLQADGRQFGLVVDEINDTEEIVVKPLGKQLKGLSAFAGATIMGDGRVALILDVMGLAQAASVVGEHREPGLGKGSAERGSAESKRTLLLFGVGGRRRMAVALDKVSRLEEFSAEQVEREGSGEVAQYRGTIMPLVRLCPRFGEEPAQATGGKAPVIVCGAGGAAVGLMVESILDIVEESVALDRRRSSGGVLGSCVVQGKVTEMLDVDAIVREALGESPDGPEPTTAETHAASAGSMAARAA